MTKEEVLILLREGLSIRLDKDITCNMNESKLRVKLFLYGEEISSDYQIITESDE